MEPATDPPAGYYRAVFFALAAPMLILDTDLTIQDANPAYLTATSRDRDDLVGQNIFDAFPPNPGFPEGDGVDKLLASLVHVLTSGQIHSMGVQRYDVPWPDTPDGFVERYWCPVNTPITDANGEVIAILHAVEDVTDYHEDVAAALRFYHQEISSQGASEETLRLRFADYAKVAMRNARRYTDVVSEVENLREALTSRALIEQAKGIIMVRNHCSPDEAFDLLVTTSQRNNIKVRDLAGVLVRRTANDPQGTAEGGSRV